MTPTIILKPFSQRDTLLTVGPAPHWRSGRTLRQFMFCHILALLPAIVMAAYYFGLPALRVVATCGLSAVLTQWGCCRLMHREPDVDNYGALYIGLLLSFLLPATAPWWLALLGPAIAVSLGMAVFGGLGQSPINPVVLAWAVLTVSWPGVMDIDLSLAASSLNYPLAQLKFYGVHTLSQFSYLDFLAGNQLGGIGASQAGALILGGIFLMVRGMLRPFIPLAFLVGVLAMAGLFHVIYPQTTADPLFHVLTGSTLLGALFLAPDSGSSPCGRLPMLLYGFIGGCLVVMIRTWGVYPDATPFAVMLANLLAPLLDRIRPVPFTREVYHA
ncbi:MAG: RnfABCDGE type electron transport complex subunit D [Desulfovibrio sp.]|uniref:RnfABCDGE type electron transport complex subunit D n=1 Tax=Desulfovibrio sp. 7SRBS1 TaxID=3378064 RepID=UPI003B3EE694